MPDGHVIYASSLRTHKDQSDSIPDFGLYLDSAWDPASLAYQVSWRDHGLPVYMTVAYDAIVDVWSKVLDGQNIEVGCIGGHGRTGTVLACFAILAGAKSAEEAIAHVHTHYCNRAVEGDEQKWFVSWFEAKLHNRTLAVPTPVSKTKANYGTSSFYWNNDKKGVEITPGSYVYRRLVKPLPATSSYDASKNDDKTGKWPSPSSVVYCQDCGLPIDKVHTVAVCRDEQAKRKADSPYTNWSNWSGSSYDY